MESLIEVFNTNAHAWTWLLILVFFAIMELISVSAFSIWFVLGAFVAMLTSFVTQNVWVELTVFIVFSVFTLVTLRTWAIEWLKIGSEKTNLDSLIGQKGVVLTTILPLDPGTIKLEGKTWRCQSLTEQVYQPDEVVVVHKIEGVTIYVD